MSRVELQPAWLLHQRDYRETSRIAELFTRDHGRVGIVVKGVRGRRKSTLSGDLQAFRPLLVSWSGRGELHAMTTVEPAGPTHSFSGDALLAGLYLNELLIRLCARDDPQPEAFSAYGQAMVALGYPDRMRIGLRLFEKQLLDVLGYGLVLECDTDGEPLEAAGLYRYEPESGPVRINTEQVGAVHGATLLALAAGEMDNPRIQAEARDLLRSCLDCHLGIKPLRSRELLLKSRHK